MKELMNIFVIAVVLLAVCCFEAVCGFCKGLFTSINKKTDLSPVVKGPFLLSAIMLYT